MDFELTDEQLELQRIARDVLDSEVPASLARDIAEGSGSADELWATLTSLDSVSYTHLTLPTKA